MSTLTITEFLEARIAEDEAEASWRAADRASRASVVGGVVPDLVTPERMLAECAAKRAILAFDEDLQIWEPRGSGADTSAEAFTRGGPKDPHARHVTRILAAVYKDHPDYRQEWAK